MKKTSFFLSIAAISAVIFSACNNSTSTTTSTETTTATSPAADNSVKQAKLTKINGTVINAKFGLDCLTDKVWYNVSYEYKEGANREEILHGKFTIITAETVDEFIERNLPKGTDPAEEAGFSLRFDYSDDKIEGQFAEGKKDGKMTFGFSGHESGAEGFIIFDAKTGGTTSAKYSGGAESTCVAYEGPLKTGTFKELYTLTKEVEC
jgi:hypothetical protein